VILRDIITFTKVLSCDCGYVSERFLRVTGTRQCLPRNTGRSRPAVLSNPKPRLIMKWLRKYRVNDAESCVILPRTSYHVLWNSHLVTERQKAPEFTLVPRQPTLKLKPSEMGAVLILARYLGIHSVLATYSYFEALAGDSVQ
jgi:hypothetical protein